MSVVLVVPVGVVGVQQGEPNQRKTQPGQAILMSPPAPIIKTKPAYPKQQEKKHGALSGNGRTLSSCRPARIPEILVWVSMTYWGVFGLASWGVARARGRGQSRFEDIPLLVLTSHLWVLARYEYWSGGDRRSLVMGVSRYYVACVYYCGEAAREDTWMRLYGAQSGGALWGGRGEGLLGCSIAPLRQSFFFSSQPLPSSRSSHPCPGGGAQVLGTWYLSWFVRSRAVSGVMREGLVDEGQVLVDLG